MNMFHSSQTSSMKWRDAPTRRVDAAGTKFVYRQARPHDRRARDHAESLGRTLDNFDPRIVDGLAATRPVIAVNYRGVGASGGKAPLTVAEMAEDMIAFIRALDLERSRSDRLLARRLRSAGRGKSRTWLASLRKHLERVRTWRQQWLT